MHLTLGKLINLLKQANQKAIIRNGFHHPHSYRGYYERLCFEPAENVKVSDMLAEAKNALGNTYGGWKGGEYTMDADTLVHINDKGRSDHEERDALTDHRLKLMLSDELDNTEILLYV